MRRYIDVTYFAMRSISPDTVRSASVFFVDASLKHFGVLFLLLGLVMIAVMVWLYYFNILPYMFACSQVYAACHLLFGHYILVNIAYHYYKSVITPPGKPYREYALNRPDIKLPVCSKCQSPKPPRTHHCSICNRCVLKMDHHCPWVNNCIGHYNHRYFLQLCVFMWIGAVYSSIAVWPVFYQTVYQEFLGTAVQGNNEDEGKIELSVHSVHSVIYDKGILLELYPVCFVFIMGALSLWHMRLITRGETSIEAQINYSETKRLRQLGSIYQNPYDFGPLENWRKFLGLGFKRKFWSHIAFPSGHGPEGNGYQWNSNNNRTDNASFLV